MWSSAGDEPNPGGGWIDSTGGTGITGFGRGRRAASPAIQGGDSGPGIHALISAGEAGIKSRSLPVVRGQVITKSETYDDG